MIPFSIPQTTCRRIPSMSMPDTRKVPSSGWYRQDLIVRPQLSISPMYFIVVSSLVCPISSLTSTTCLPLIIRWDANVWRRSWNRIGFTPAAIAMGRIRRQPKVLNSKSKMAIDAVYLKNGREETKKDIVKRLGISIETLRDRLNGLSKS